MVNAPTASCGGSKNRGPAQTRQTYGLDASASDPPYRLPTRSSRAFSEPARGIGLGSIRRKLVVLSNFIFFHVRQQTPIFPKP
jgi:hypothetical protein